MTTAESNPIPLTAPAAPLPHVSEAVVVSPWVSMLMPTIAIVAMGWKILADVDRKIQGMRDEMRIELKDVNKELVSLGKSIAVLGAMHHPHPPLLLTLPSINRLRG